MVGIALHLMMMSRSDFLSRVLSDDEEQAVNRIVSAIEQCGSLPKEQLINATLMATIGLLTSIDREKAHYHMIEGAEAAAEISGKPIAIFYKDVDSVAHASH